MQITITTNQILKVLEILSWIIFIGLCVEAGAIAFNMFFTLVINPKSVENFWEGRDYLSALHGHDIGHFFAVTFIMLIVAVLKAIMFYLILRLFLKKKIDLSRPFSPEFQRFLSILAFLTLGIGFFCNYGKNYSGWLATQGVERPDLDVLHLAGGDVWFFMTVILFVIAQVVRKGVDMQTENDLTI